MRLSRGESFFLVLIVVMSSIFIFMPMGHTEQQEHKISLGRESTSSAKPTWELYQLAVREGVIPTKWTIYWRGSITAQEEVPFTTWLEKTLFTKQMETKSTKPNGLVVIEQVWKRELNGTIHQVQVFYYPQKSKKMANFIYTWSGTEMSKQWLDTYQKTEQNLLQLVQQLPQNFSCIEGFTNDKLNFSLLKNNIFDRWVTDTLQGEIIHQVSDQNFTSLNGYIPTWGEHFLSTGDQKINLQLSARYNALEDRTRVTIGYPLILKEH
jgi:hypothetical protein